MFAIELPSSFSLDNSPIAGLGVFEDFRRDIAKEQIIAGAWADPQYQQIVPAQLQLAQDGFLWRAAAET